MVIPTHETSFVIDQTHTIPLVRLCSCFSVLPQLATCLPPICHFWNNMFVNFRPLDTHANHCGSQSLAIPSEFLLTGMHLNELLWYGLADKQVFAPRIHRKKDEGESANFPTLACARPASVHAFKQSSVRPSAYCQSTSLYTFFHSAWNMHTL